MSDKNREKWLNDAVDHGVRDLFADAGYALPEYYAAVSIPTASDRSANHVLGACYYNGPDGLCQIMVNPIVRDGILALEVLIHELVHAVCGPDAKHGPVFKRCALAVGLKGGPLGEVKESMRATVGTPELKEKLAAIVSKIGEYPHPGLNLGGAKRKKQSTRNLKLACPECSFQVRASGMQIDFAHAWGGLICPMCNVAMIQP